MKRTTAFGLVGVAFVTGCGGILHRVDKEPESPVEVSDDWSSKANALRETTTATVTYSAADPWWESFDDPELNRVMGLAFQRNLDLVVAYARLEQAKALRKSARSGYFPTVDAEASVTRSLQQFNFQGRTNEIENTAYRLGVSAAYEVDIWGRVGHSVEAAKREFVASEEDIVAATISISGEVADTYFQIVEQRDILRLLRDQLASNLTQLELIEYRFDQGIATGLDVFQQRQQVARIRTQIPDAQRRVALFENTLALLLGREPNTLSVVNAELPAPPPVPAVGIPSEVLLQRPDVRAAQLRMVAQDHRIGSAIADRYPRLNLTAGIGGQSFDSINIFEGFFYNLAAGLAGPVFDGRRRKAEVERNQALFEERAAQYARAVLTAVNEVENALAQELYQKDQIAAFERQLEASRNTLEQARLQYVNGLIDYLPVLTALEEIQALEREILSSRRILLSFRILLHRALGGSWARGLEPARLSRAEAEGEGESS